MPLIKSYFTRKKWLLEDAHLFPVPIINFEKKYIFYWSAKSGCTQATRAILEDIGIIEPENSTVFPPDHPNYTDELRRAYYNKFGLNLRTVYDLSRDKSYLKLKLVRDPRKRIVSSFVMLMRHYVGSSGADETGILKQISTSINKDAQDISFLDFCRHLNTINLNKSDWHVQLQSHPFEVSKKVKIDRVVRLENYYDDFKRIIDEYRLDINIVDEKKEFQHYNKQTDDIKDLVTSRPFIEYFNNIPKYNYFYDDETSHIINNTYKHDFRLYRYS